MDQLWMLYLEQQAQAAKASADGRAEPAPPTSSPVSAFESGKSGPTLICEEPTGE
jgi:hypothetical protein